MGLITYFSIGFKGNLIKAYFKDIDKKIKINYLEEKKRLGTAGGLKKLRAKSESFSLPIVIPFLILILTNYLIFIKKITSILPLFYHIKNLLSHMESVK